MVLRSSFLFIYSETFELAFAVSTMIVSVGIFGWNSWFARNLPVDLDYYIDSFR